jgi:AbiTii
MTLLQQIQNEAVETHGDIGALLRRCRILAQRLKVDEFKQWVVWELEGYPSSSPLPEYRIICTRLIIRHFHGIGGSRITNAQIPIAHIPKKYREMLTTFSLYQGIGAIAELLRDTKDTLRIPWPADVLRYIGQGDIYSNHNLMQAWRVVSTSDVRDVLDQVQNRVLNFVLELESRNPEAGEAIMNSPRIPTDQVRNIFHTTITGNVQNLAQASERFSQHGAQSVVTGDVSTLRRALAEIGLPEPELAELESAISHDMKTGTKGMGDKVKAWLGNIMVKASEGAITIATSAGTVAVTEAVKAYFGK